MSSYRRKLWQYPLFQIPLICFGLCLAAAALFWLLGFGRPQVAVAIALDLSNSTFGGQVENFNRPGTISYQEIKAVEAYLQQNNGEMLRRPNQVKVFGFGDSVEPLTGNFDSNSDNVKQSLQQALNPSIILPKVNPDYTNIDLAIKTASNSLRAIQNRCRELILVTDGQVEFNDPGVIAEAKLLNIKINSVVVGAEAPELRGAALVTGGTYLSGDTNNLSAFFTNNFFSSFNSNLKWIIFWLGLAWISLMWTLLLPLDRWVFQGLFSMRIDQSGKLAISHAIFWTVVTLSAIWRFWGIPFLSGC